MTSTVKLSFGQRCISYLSTALNFLVYGRVVPFQDEFIGTYGAKNLLEFSKKHAVVSKELYRCYGIRDANILIGFAATWNGCRFCSRSHVWVANLYHLRDHNELFPIDDAEIPQLQKLTDPEILQILKEKLSAPQYHKLRDLLERQYQLKYGNAVGQTPDDVYLQLVNSMWDFLNECSILVEEDEVFPMDPIRKNRALTARYLQLRGRPWEKS